MALTEESRFQHLLQPIRDLAGNWDINIANELEEYLASLMHGQCMVTTPHEALMSPRIIVQCCRMCWRL